MPHRTVLLAAALASLCTLGVPRNASSQCHDGPWEDYADPAGRHDYRIHYQTFDYIDNPDVTYTTGSLAFMHSADVWNEQSNGGYFHFDGWTTYDDLPDLVSQCSTQYPGWADCCDYSILTVRDGANCPSNLALTVPKCFDGTGYRQSLVLINAQDQNCDPFPWSVGTPGAGEWDIPAVMAHEMGHAIGMDHSTNNEPAVMLSWVGSGRLRRRELYQYDSECVASESGYRSLTGYHRYISGSSFDTETSFTSTNDVARLAAGVTKQSGAWQFSAAIDMETALYWNRQLSMSNNALSGLSNDVPSLANVVWREDETMDRIFTTSTLEYPTSYDADSDRRISYVRSSDGFSTRYTGSLSYCTTMSSWMTCTGTTYATSGKAVGVAWHDGLSRSVTAWASQVRADDSQTNKVYVSVGYINNLTVPTPDYMGVQSVIPPAVACKDLASGYDCILAYVDQTERYYDVKVLRFNISAGGTRYSVTIDGTKYTPGVRTDSRVAAWYHDGKFWIAARSSWYEDAIYVYYSTAGSSWTSAGTVGTSAVGVSAASYWNSGNNVLLYAR